MKKFILTIFVFISVIQSSINAQTYKTVTIVPQTTKSLNSGGRAMLGGVSRIAIKVDLPENTVEWYYSFTTSAGSSGTELLNLGTQVLAYATTGPLGATVAKGLKVPPGSGSVDVWLMPIESIDNFNQKNDGEVKIYKDLSEVNTKQSVKPISTLLKGSYYLGLRNPSAMDAINITIEVVAIVKIPDENEEKGKLYGSMGWKSYEKGDYDECLEFSLKALTFNPNLSWVKFNVALVYLRQQNEKYLDEYIDAIALVRKLNGSKNTLQGALDDVRNLKDEIPELKHIDEIEELLINEIAKYD